MTNLLGALVTLQIVWIRFFNFDIYHVPGIKHIITNNLFQRPCGEGKVEEKEDIDNWINLKLNVIYVTTSETQEVRDDILKSKYLKEYQKITQYLIILKRSEEMNRFKF